jgi:hypothetical protein
VIREDAGLAVEAGMVLAAARVPGSGSAVAVTVSGAVASIASLLHPSPLSPLPPPTPPLTPPTPLPTSTPPPPPIPTPPLGRAGRDRGGRGGVDGGGTCTGGVSTASCSPAALAQLPDLERMLTLAGVALVAAGEEVRKVATARMPCQRDPPIEDVAAAAAAAAAEVEGSTAEAFHAFLEMRESAAVLTGWSVADAGCASGSTQSEGEIEAGTTTWGGDSLEPRPTITTMRRGIIRLDTLCVASVPAPIIAPVMTPVPPPPTSSSYSSSSLFQPSASTSSAPAPGSTPAPAVTEVGTADQRHSARPTAHEASLGPPLMHSVLLEGLSLHVAAPVPWPIAPRVSHPATAAAAAAAFLDPTQSPLVLSRMAGFPCTARALRSAGIPCVAREAAVQGEVRTGGGGVPLAAIRATSLCCDVRRDSLAAASALAQAITSTPPSPKTQNP